MDGLVVSSLQWITGQNTPMMSPMDSTPGPKSGAKFIHQVNYGSGSLELQAVIIHCFPPKHTLETSKESTALFLRWKSQTALKKKSTLARDARSMTRVSPNQRHPAWLRSFPFLLSGAASPRGVSALTQSRAGECGGDASAQSNPVCGIIQIEAMPFQDCWTGLVSMLQIAGRQVT